MTMKKTMLAMVAAAVMAGGALVAPQPAAAGGGHWVPGLIGGLAVGAIVGGAIANSHPRYAEPGYGYYEPAPVYGSACGWRRERFWDGYGWRVRRVQVCD